MQAEADQRERESFGRGFDAHPNSFSLLSHFSRFVSPTIECAIDIWRVSEVAAGD